MVGGGKLGEVEGSEQQHPAEEIPEIRIGFPLADAIAREFGLPEIHYKEKYFDREASRKRPTSLDQRDGHSHLCSPGNQDIDHVP